MKKLMKLSGAILILATAAGCSGSGYPKPEKRIENIEDTIKDKNLSGETNDGRKSRFDDNHQRTMGGTNKS